ncbi:hypothetical protein QZH41_002873 [Actinostola sp. cb2023]|nr:hypothetical protein QZH41_002873 [Actinostola sp. cb2023]
MIKFSVVSQCARVVCWAQGAQAMFFDQLYFCLTTVQAEPGGISIPYSNGVFHMGTTPVFTSSIYGSSEDSLYDHPGGTEVLFINLTEQTCFDKIQSRRGGLAKMRVTNGVVQMVCQSPVQILSIKVFVFREPSAAELCGDDNGRMELPVLMGNMDVQGDSRDCQQFFSVNLDSIYDGPKKPAYELAKVEMEVRNHFQLAVQVQYIGGVGYQEFTKSEGSEERANSPDTTRPRQDSGGK